MAFWGVAQTQPFSEQKAKRFLESQAFDCYLPRVKLNHFVKNVRRERIVALFARYLFVQIADHWHAINSTPGISCLLVNDKSEPILVRDRVIAELRSRENSNGLVVLPKKEKFRRGQKVVVLSGQFAGSLALYDGMSCRQRERVLLELLGQFVPVELNIDSKLEAITVH